MDFTTFKNIVDEVFRSPNGESNLKISNFFGTEQADIFTEEEVTEMFTHILNNKNYFLEIFDNEDVVSDFIDVEIFPSLEFREGLYTNAYYLIIKIRDYFYNNGITIDNLVFPSNDHDFDNIKKVFDFFSGFYYFYKNLNNQQIVKKI
jgi:hypothetical protein